MIDSSGTRIEGEGARALASVAVLVTLQGLITSMLVVGIVRVVREPFLWAVVIAVLTTAKAGFELMDGEANLFTYALCVFFWGAVVPTRKIRALVQEYPDLYVAKKVLGASTMGGAGADPLRGRGIPDPESQARTRRVLLWSVLGVGGGGAIALIGLLVLLRPPSLEDAGMLFAAEWNRAGLSSASAWVDPELEGIVLLYLMNEEELRGWSSEWPKMSEQARLVREESADVLEFDLEGARLRTVWEKRKGRWTLLELQVPFLDLGTRFVEAWNAADTGVVAEFYRNPTQGRGTLDRLIAEKGWDGLPTLTGYEVEPRGLARSLVRAETAQGTFEFTFEIVENSWVLRRFKPPIPR